MIRGLSSLKMQDESIQSLTECLCDGKDMPLLHDPLVKEVGLCYKALPHYKKFVKQREMRIDQIIRARDNVEAAAKSAFEEAGRLEQEAERGEKKAAEKEEAAENQDKKKHKKEREEHKEKKEKHRNEKEKQKQTLDQIEVEFPKCKAPILAEKKKKLKTNKIERKMKIQDIGSNSFRRFQVGATLAGNLENQY